MCLGGLPVGVSSKWLPSREVGCVLQVATSPMLRLRLVVASLSSLRHAAALSTAPLPRAPEQLHLPAGAPHPATCAVDDLMRECEVRHTKGSGPGGQHRNKVQTAVVVTHTPTSLVGSASESRSQQANLGKAIFRLRVRLALKCRTASPLDAAASLQEPSALWASRTRSGKIAVNANHVDFPAVLAEALDSIWEARDVKTAAEALGVSTSQITKLLAKEPAALTQVNAFRASSGLPALRANK